MAQNTAAVGSDPFGTQAWISPGSCLPLVAIHVWKKKNGGGSASACSRDWSILTSLSGKPASGAKTGDKHLGSCHLC